MAPTSAFIAAPFKGLGAGVDLLNSTGSKLSGLTLQQDFYGILVEMVIATTITDNVIIQNGDAGVFLLGDSRENILDIRSGRHEPRL